MLMQMLLKTVEQCGDKVALVCDRNRISYSDLYALVIGLSNGLKSLGIQESDCIALILPNCPEFIISFFAVAKLNAIVLPLNPLFKEDELKYYISDSNVKAIITDVKRIDACTNITSQIGREVFSIVIDRDPEKSSLGLDFYGLTGIEGKALNWDQSNFHLGPVLYQYSSGSTGRPKRVSRTQENLVCEANNFISTTGINSSDNILCLVPLFHAHGLGNCLLAAVRSGASLVILEQPMQNGVPVEVPFIFRRSRVLELIEQEKITILPGVPYVFATLAATPVESRADLSTLKLCFSAGNFLSKEVFDQFIQRFCIPVKQLYGCTEAGSIAINLECGPEIKYNSVGLPINNVKVSVIDDQGREVPDGEIGELLINSQALTDGYYNMPELNQEAFKNSCFLTGDLGRKDAEGFIYITGRKKIFIDTGGRKVDPLDIEDVLVKHPKVSEVVVVGVNSQYGEIIKAVVVPKGECQEQELLTYCKDRLAEFKIPKIIEFRQEIPKSPLGKVLRKNLV